MVYKNKTKVIIFLDVGEVLLDTSGKGKDRIRFLWNSIPNPDRRR